MLKNLLNKKSKIAVIAGAGASLDAPSNLLDGWSFMFEALRRVCPPEIDGMLARSSEELKQDNAWKQSWVLSILALPDVPFYRPGEQLRFEVLMAELIQSGLDPALSVLRCLDDCDRPNQNHYVLAQLIRSGHIVMTTNFDRLIELAYANLAGEGEPPLRVVCMDDEFPKTGPLPGDPPALWKLHGSLSVNGEDTRRSIQATMMSILTTAMTARKSAFLKQVLANFDLLVVGYSGWDDLDIIPTLSNVPSKQRLIWIDHKDVPEPDLKDAVKLNEEARSHWEIDSVGRDRIRFTTDANGHAIRDPRKVLVVSTPTSRMMDAVREVYLASRSFNLQEDDFRFGSRFPEEVQRYFDNWRASLSHNRSAPYKFVGNIFSNLANARDDVKQRTREVYREIEELEAAPTATPAEQLQHLIRQFNQDPENRVAVEQLRDKLLILAPSLPVEWVGTGARLFACMVWALDGAAAGTEAFKTAVAIDRQAGREKEEFNTLSTWRSFAGYSQWSDLYADENDEMRERVSESYLKKLRDEAAYMASYSGGLPFPEQETRRIHELAGKIGFFPILWAQAVRGIYHAIDSDPSVLKILHARIRRIRRFCVDLGDVLGEAQTTVICGRMYAIGEQYQIAIEELLRAEELHRIVRDTGLELDIMLNLKYCTDQFGVEYMKKIKPHLQRSMWGEVVE